MAPKSGISQIEPIKVKFPHSRKPFFSWIHRTPGTSCSKTMSRPIGIQHRWRPDLRPDWKKPRGPKFVMDSGMTNGWSSTMGSEKLKKSWLANARWDWNLSPIKNVVCWEGHISRLTFQPQSRPSKERTPPSKQLPSPLRTGWFAGYLQTEQYI